MKHIFLTVGLFFSCSLLGTAITEDAFFTDLGTFDHDETNHTAGINSVHWLECGGKKYLAIGGEAGDNGFHVRVLRFDNFNGGTLSALPGGGVSATDANPGGNQIHGETTQANVNSVQWIDCGVNKFLAIGGAVATDPAGEDSVGVTTRVYSFDSVDETIVQKSAGAHGTDTGNDEVLSVAWCKVGTQLFLATGGTVVSDITTRVYKVDPSQPDLTAQALAGSNVNNVQTVETVAWLVCGDDKFLATGGSKQTNADPTTRIYSFDGSSLSEVAAMGSNLPIIENDIVREVAWVVCNGKKYLASAIANGTVTIHEFNTDTRVATKIGDDVVVAQGSVQSLAWLNCGGTKYLATGDTGNNTKVFRFDPDSTEVLIPITSATKVHETDGNAENVNAVAWLQCGALTFLAMGGDNTGVLNGDTTNRVYQVNFDDDATNELLRNKFFQVHDALTSPGATAGL